MVAVDRTLLQLCFTSTCPCFQDNYILSKRVPVLAEFARAYLQSTTTTKAKVITALKAWTTTDKYGKKRCLYEELRIRNETNG